MVWVDTRPTTAATIYCRKAMEAAAAAAHQGIAALDAIRAFHADAAPAASTGHRRTVGACLHRGRSRWLRRKGRRQGKGSLAALGLAPGVALGSDALCILSCNCGLGLGFLVGSPLLPYMYTMKDRSFLRNAQIFSLIHGKQTDP